LQFVNSEIVQFVNPAAPRYGRHNGDVITLLYGRVFLLQVANILVVQVHVHKSAELAIIGVEVAAQVRMLSDEAGKSLAHGSTLDLHRTLFAGVLPQWSGYVNFNHSFIKEDAAPRGKDSGFSRRTGPQGEVTLLHTRDKLKTSSWFLTARRKHTKYLLQSMTDLGQLARIVSRKRKGVLLFLLRLRFCTELVASAGNGKALFIKQLPDFQNVAHIAPPIHTLPSTAFDRFELREFGFPKAQDVGRQMAEARDFPDTKIELVGYYDLAALFHFPGGLLLFCDQWLPQRR
jgi:hypothetical protein